jgi:hypothetical protein
MKHRFLLLAACLMAHAGWAQGFFQGKLGYTANAPVGQMAHSLQAAHGIDFALDWRSCHHPLSLGLEGAIATYGVKQAPISFQFSPNDLPTNTSIQVSNNLYYLLATSKFYLTPPGRARVEPYLSLGGGMVGMATILTIADPADDDACQPLVRESLNRSATAAVRAGGGIRIDMSAIFRSVIRDALFFDFSANYLHGGALRYVSHINDDFLRNYPHHHGHNGHHHQPASTGRGVEGPLEMDFVHVPTGLVHRHPVGDIYRHPLRMLSFQLGFGFRFGQPCFAALPRQ